jgi:chromosome segregation ATPase
MKLPSERVKLFLVIGVMIGVVGCGVSKDQYEETVSELNKTKAELNRIRTDLNETKSKLDKTVVELDKTKAEQEKAYTKIAEMQKSLTEAQNQLEIALERHTNEKQLMQSQFVGAQREASILRQQSEELYQSLIKATTELDMFREANEVLRGQIYKLTNERNRLQGMVKNQETDFRELQSELKESQSPGTRTGTHLIK